jgi:hypothetical protein
VVVVGSAVAEHAVTSNNRMARRCMWREATPRYAQPRFQHA